MEDKEYTWETIGYVDFWHNSTFSTIEECIIDAKRTGVFQSGDAILVGEVEHYDFTVDAEAVLEWLGEQAFNDVGEVVEGWPSSFIQNKTNY